MKKRDMQTVLDAMRKTAEDRFPEKETTDEQYKAYGKLGLLIFCQGHGYKYEEYLDELERISA